MLLDQHSVPHECHGRARLDRPVEHHCERVHGDRPDHTTSNTVDEYVRSGHVAAEPVGVPDRDQADPGRAIGDVATAVPRALTRLELLGQRDVRLPAQGRLEAVVRRIRSERRDAVERDPAPDRVEPRLGEAQHGGAVGEMARERAERGGRLTEACNLEFSEGGVRLGGREVTDHADDVAGGRRGPRSPNDPSLCRS